MTEGEQEEFKIWLLVQLVVILVLLLTPYCKRRTPPPPPSPPAHPIFNYQLAADRKRLPLQVVVKPCYSHDLKRGPCGDRYVRGKTMASLPPGTQGKPTNMGTVATIAKTPGGAMGTSKK